MKGAAALMQLSMRLLAPGDAAESQLHTLMSSTRMNLEGSPSAAAPDYSPESKPGLMQHVEDDHIRYGCCQRHTQHAFY